ncbi:hypothetical protein ACLOJK_034971 [Asimina triloba]
MKFPARWGCRLVVRLKGVTPGLIVDHRFWMEEEGRIYCGSCCRSPPLGGLPSLPLLVLMLVASEIAWGLLWKERDGGGGRWLRGAVTAGRRRQRRRRWRVVAGIVVDARRQDGLRSHRIWDCGLAADLLDESN